jgi:polar amino acid transport system substrate-binding protein
MGTQKNRAQGAAYLQAFVAQMKASGFVAQSLARHSIEGVTIPP